MYTQDRNKNKSPRILCNKLHLNNSDAIIDKRSNNSLSFNLRLIQRKLDYILEKDNDNKMDVYNYTCEQKKVNEDVNTVNEGKYEEIQIIAKNIGTIIYGKIKSEDMQEDEIIVGVTTRINSSFHENDKKPFYGDEKNPVYYDTSNEKSSEIAFSNKMSLRGYLILEEYEIKKLGKDAVELVPMEKKGKGLNVMNNKSWYFPKDGKRIRFREYKKEDANKNITAWGKYKNVPSISKKVKGIKSLIDYYNPRKILPIETSSAIGLPDILKQKGVITEGLTWAVKDENSLKKRLYNNICVEAKIKKEDIADKINIYNNNNERTGQKRTIDDFKKGIIEDLAENNVEYQWKATSIEALGQGYELFPEPRSHMEWLEILHLWEKSLHIEEVVNAWRDTADLHLDSSGLKSMYTKTNNTGADCLTMEKLGFIKNNEWKAKSIRDLGDSYAKLDQSQKSSLEWDNLLNKWNETHRVKIKYDLEDKFNTWTQGPTEWGVNSTTNVGASNETPFAGWSKFAYSEKKEEMVKFHDIRHAELPHKHPIQTEIYIVNKGTAYLMIDEGIELVECNSKVIKPNTNHCIVAIKPPYEHIVIQSPSGFHHKKNKEEVGNEKDMDRYYDEAIKKNNIHKK